MYSPYLCPCTSRLHSTQLASLLVCQYLNMNLKQESLPLISVNQKNEFYLTVQAKKMLTSLTKPIAVITIAGVYRSGKSYLVNRLLRNKQNGFATGSSVQPVTKGLNIWGKPIPAQDEHGNQFVYLVIDSEGIGSCDQEMKYDIKILMLVFLISSTVIYNSLGAIDQVALDQLRTVINLKQTLAFQESQEKVKLVWVLRDFALQLMDKYGGEISADYYLTDCLKEVPSYNAEVVKKNQIRKAIKDTFQRRRCFTLVRPTINEEDLRNLEQGKLRTEFLQGIEKIREQVFSGSNCDIKRIRGLQLSGKLLSNLLQECVSVLNQNRMPEIKTMWEFIKQCSNEQSFHQICNSLKEEVQRIQLPLSKEELKIRLNDVQNRTYMRLQKQFQEIYQYKKYNREFIHFVQKLNREVKKNNAQIAKEKVLRELRQFVKNNISLQGIQPTNLSLVKVFVDRMQLRIKGQPQGYEYVLSVLFDIMHISEQKAMQQQREVNQIKSMMEAGSLERRNNDISIAALKHDYHEALKTINNLKQMQEGNEKEAALFKQKYEMLQMSVKNIQQEAEIKQESLMRQIEQANFRGRQRVEDSSLLIKKLRDENSELQREISMMKDQKLRQGLNERKEVIFQQKMKETWDKFEQERIFFRKQLEKFRKQSQLYLQKYQQEKRNREKESQSHVKERQECVLRERQYIQQLQDIKSLHAQTKKTYNATFTAMKDNDSILKNIESVNYSHSKINSYKKINDIQGVRRHYQTELQRTRKQFQQEIKVLKLQLAQVSHQSQQQRMKYNEQQFRYRSCLSQKQRLQRQLQSANQRFSQTVSEIQLAKQRQRSLYQDSIVRLLSNIDKRESSASQSAFYRR